LRPVDRGHLVRVRSAQGSLWHSGDPGDLERAPIVASQLRWGCGVESAGDEEHAAVEFDEPVDCSASDVGGAVGVEVGQERFLPLLEGAAEAGDLGDRAAREPVDNLDGEGLSGLGVCWW